MGAMPDKDNKWDLCNVERCFGSTDNWLRAKEKVIEAAETSCLIESEKLSEGELAIQLKQRRRKRAKVILSSDEGSEPSINRNLSKTMKPTNTSLILPNPPPMYSSTPARRNNAIMPHKINIYPTNSQVNGNTTQHRHSEANTASTSSGRDSILDPYISELGFRKFVVKTLTTLIMEVKDLNEKVNTIKGAKLMAQEENIEDILDEEPTFPFIKSESDLITFERKLKDKLFFKRMTLRLANMGYGKLGIAVCAICSKVMEDSIAMNFTWLGRLKKRCFSKLTTARLIQKSLHMIGKEAWSPTEINHAIAKWLSQSKTRLNRSKIEENHASDNTDAE